MDFTLKIYQTLLNSLQKQDFSFQAFLEYMVSNMSPTQGGLVSPSGDQGERKGKASKIIILRHDVDKLPENSLKFAQIQHELGIKGSYYFRIVPESFNPVIIVKIAELGHEIGYHYETFDEAVKSFKHQTPNFKFLEKDIAEKAIELFEKHLAELRKYYPVKTICMHGSPLSKYDNKLLWKYYKYQDYGIIGEPYFDVDFSEVLYLTDTGRRWDGDRVSIRDKVLNHKSQITNHTLPIANFHSTKDIITAANKRLLPNQVMFTFHPQRWTDKPLSWLKELAFQNTKNFAKYFLNKLRE